jgi:hypothetical protein
MPKLGHDFSEGESEFTDAIERDWQKIQRENPPLPHDRSNTPFEPVEALNFAQQLANTKSEEEAIIYMSCNHRGLAAFLMAAHFAFPYLPATKDAASENDLRYGLPYVALAKAVADFLNSLKPQRE